MFFILLIMCSHSNFSTGENERQWLFTIPFLIFPVAQILVNRIQKHNNLYEYYLFLSCSFLQSWIFEILIDTKW